MSTSLRVSAPSIAARPGDTAEFVLSLHNGGSSDARFVVHAVGLDRQNDPAMRTNGSSPPDPRPPLLDVVVAAGDTIDAVVPVQVPLSLGAGDHAAAFQVTSNRPDHPPFLEPFILSVGSLDDVIIDPHPAPLRGRRRAKLAVDVTNHKPEPVDLRLTGEAADVEVEIVKPKDASLRLLPGQQARTKVKLVGPRLWTGEELQHNITLTATGPTSATSVTTPFVQRALVPLKLRMILALVTVLALLVGGVVWWLQRDDADGRDYIAVDADGDGLIDPQLDENGDPIPGTGGEPANLGNRRDDNGDGFFDPLLDADGNPIPGTGGAPVGGVGSGRDEDGDGLFDPLLDAEGNPIPGTGGAPVSTGSGFDRDGDGLYDPLLDAAGREIPGTGGGLVGGVGDEIADGPADVTLNGTVTADGVVSSDGDTGITVRLNPINLGEVADGAASRSGFRSRETTVDAEGTSPSTGVGFSDDSPYKIWSARFSAVAARRDQVRQTETLFPKSVSPTGDSVWKFEDIPRRRSYELIFAKEGFDTQSFVVTPPEEGDPEPIDVELVPAVGVLAGRTLEGSSALAGADITVTDGTLIFETTSATVADTSEDGLAAGGWRLEGLSTPATYTVTATKDGYGTVVEQVQLGPGGQNTNVDLQLTLGVGSIGGTVTDPLRGNLGGVTITATSSLNTRTTSSFTEGGIVGGYSLPELSVPGDYTVTAERDGYVTQSRRVRLPLESGSLNGVVNFDMVRTTQQLTGTVTNLVGTPIDSALITLSKGDLEFQTQTTASGAWDIDDLPPGIYVITADHVDHTAVTRIVEVVAGVPEPSVDFALAPIGERPALPVGSIKINAFDSTTGDPIPTDLTITRIFQGGAPIIEVKPNGGVLSDLEPGVYRVQVTAQFYEDSAFREIAVTPGQEIPVIFNLQRSGAAFGFLVDNATSGARQIITDLYSLRVFLVRDLDNRALDIELPDRIVPDNDGKWETGPILRPGIWRIEVADTPLGYFIDHNQTLDPDIGQPMMFEIPEEAEEPIEVADIVASPYPNLLGTIVTPDDVGGAISWVPVTDPGLKIGFTCQNATPYEIGATTDNPLRGDDGAARPGSFFVPRRAVDIRDLLGDGSTPSDCDVTISSTTTPAPFATITVRLDDVQVSNGVTLTDRVVNIAVYDDPPDLAGTAFWYDFGITPPAKVTEALDGTIEASAIVDFIPNDVVTPTTIEFPQFDDENDQFEPPTPRTDVITSPIDEGAWAFMSPPLVDGVFQPGDEQIFGTSTYEFTVDGFGDTSLEVIVDENGRRIGAAKGMNVDASLGQQNLQLELTPADKQTITGTLNVLTNDVVDLDYPTPCPAAPDDDDLCITVTAPADPRAAGSTLNDPPATGGAFSITDAYPGTWTVGFGAVPNHEYRTPSANDPNLTDPGVPATTTDSHTDRLFPATTLGGFDATLVELGKLEIELREIDANGVDIGPVTGADGAAVTITSTDPNYPAPAQGAFDATTNRFVQPNIAVHDSDPLGIPISYDIKIAVPGFDTRTAQVLDANGNNLAIPQFDELSVDLGRRSYTAGTKDLLTVRMVRFGTITGQVVGRTSPTTTTGLDKPASGDPVVTAVRVLDLDGTPAVNPVAPGVEGPVNGAFTISGPPGYYRITVDHPGYRVQNPPVVPIGTTRVPADVNRPIERAGLYVMENNPIEHQLNGNFELDIVRGSVDLTALRRLADPTSIVTTATYHLSSPTLGTTFGRVGATGNFDIPDLYPGTYTLEVRAYPTLPLTDPIPEPTAAGQDSFPAILEITVPEGTKTAPGKVTVRAPLPSLAGDLVGTMRAENRNGTPSAVPLPVVHPGPNPPAGPVVLTADYTEPKIEVDGAPRNNTATGDATAAIQLDPNAPIGKPVYTYRFSDPPTGMHTITAPEIAGYVRPNPATRVIQAGGVLDTTVPEFVYTVADTDVTFTLNPDANTNFYRASDLTVSITSPSGVVYTQFQLDINGATGVATVTVFDVAPEIGMFVIAVDSPLHAPATKQVPIDVDVGGDGTPVGAVDMTGDMTRLVVDVDQNTGTTPNAPLGPTGVITLTPTNPVGTAITLAHVNGVAERVLPPGQYDIQATNPGDGSTRGYEPSPLIPITLVGGTRNQLDTIVLKRLARVTVPISNAGDVTNPSPELVSTTNGDRFSPNVGTSFVFDVPADTYSVEFSADDYPLTEVSTSDFTVLVGQERTLAAITLPRVVVVQVTGVATASVTIQPLGSGKSVTQAGQSTTELFIFRSTDRNPIPQTGGIKVIVKSGGAGTTSQEFAYQLGTSVTIPLILRPVVTVTGTLTFPGGVAIGSVPTGTKITATTPAKDGDPAASIDGTITTENGQTTYEIAGLSTTETNKDRTWTIKLDQRGLGTVASGPGREVKIQKSSGPFATKNLTVVPQDVVVTFTLASSAGRPLTGAVVSVGTQASGTRVSSSAFTAVQTTATVTVPENVLGDSLKWDVDGGAEHTDENGTLQPFTALTAEVGNAQTPIVLTSTRIAGVVSDETGTKLAGVTLSMCVEFNTNNPPTCSRKVTATSETGASLGEFSFVPQAAGTYTIEAQVTVGTGNNAVRKTGSGLVTVGSNGVPDPTSVAITVKPPPPPPPPPPTPTP